MSGVSHIKITNAFLPSKFRKLGHMITNIAEVHARRFSTGAQDTVVLMTVHQDLKVFVPAEFKPKKVVN